MNQDINLHCFPKRRDEALAMFICKIKTYLTKLI